MESITPNIFVNDIRATSDFYKKLGFEIVTSIPDGSGGDQFVMMRNGSVAVMFQTFESLGNLLPAVRRENGGSLLLYIKMKGIETFYNRIKDEVETPGVLGKTFYGATEFSVTDVNNYVLTFAEYE